MAGPEKKDRKKSQANPNAEEGEIYQVDIITSIDHLAQIEKDYAERPQFRKEVDAEIAALVPIIRANPEIIAYQLAVLGISTVYLEDDGTIQPFDMTRLAVVDMNSAGEEEDALH